jgi:hypothetical protein
MESKCLFEECAVAFNLTAMIVLLILIFMMIASIVIWRKCRAQKRTNIPQVAFIDHADDIYIINIDEICDVVVMTV